MFTIYVEMVGASQNTHLKSTQVTNTSVVITQRIT